MLKLMPGRLNATAVLFSAVLFVSCKKDIIEEQIVSAPVKTASWTTTATTASSASTYSGLSVNFDNRANGGYGYSQATQDFKTVSFWGDISRSNISNGRLRTTLTKNLLGGEGGNISRVDVPDGTEYQLSYDMMFDQNFDFSWGGKVGFGFLIGNGYTGGTPGWDGNGGSFRLMWYKNTSTSPVYLKPYVYYKDQPGTYGNDFGKKFPATGSIEKGKWYNVKMYMKANTGSNTNGWVKLVINGTTIMDQAIRWTTNDLKRMVNNVSFETFRGGAETYWQSGTDGDIYFDNVSWSQLAK